jgi:hypothetical protein
MADEHSRMEASQALAEQLGSAAAAALMECIPPFGWHEIATKEDIARQDELFALRLDARIGQAENRIVRWLVGSIFVGMPAMAAFIAGMVRLDQVAVAAVRSAGLSRRRLRRP